MLHSGIADLSVVVTGWRAYLEDNEAFWTPERTNPMNEMTTPTYDLIEIERQARVMRAQMMSSGVRKALAWLRKPRRTAAKGQAHPA